MDLEKAICKCGEWQISGFLCPHVYRCVDVDRREIAAALLHNKISKEALLNTYNNLINPVANFKAWLDMNVEGLQPPSIVKQPRRQKRG